MLWTEFLKFSTPWYKTPCYKLMKVIGYINIQLRLFIKLVMWLSQVIAPCFKCKGWKMYVLSCYDSLLRELVKLVIIEGKTVASIE